MRWDFTAASNQLIEHSKDFQAGHLEPLRNGHDAFHWAFLGLDGLLDFRCNHAPTLIAEDGLKGGGAFEEHGSGECAVVVDDYRFA